MITSGLVLMSVNWGCELQCCCAAVSMQPDVSDPLQEPINRFPMTGWKCSIKENPPEDALIYPKQSQSCAQIHCNTSVKCHVATAGHCFILQHCNDM